MRVHELDRFEMLRVATPTERRVAHNTYVRRVDDIVKVRYHNTDIVSILFDGSSVVHVHGYETATTKTRVNCLIPSGILIYQQDWRWYVRANNGTFYYQDYGVFNNDGTVELLTPLP